MGAGHKPPAPGLAAGHLPRLARGGLGLGVGTASADKRQRQHERGRRPHGTPGSGGRTVSK